MNRTLAGSTTCEFCDMPIGRRRRFCSRACYASHRLRPRYCALCGEYYDVPRNAGGYVYGTGRILCFDCRPAGQGGRPRKVDVKT